MRIEVITHNKVQGFHNWPEAPEICGYLANRHRHNFVIRCRFNVSHNGREIEINTMQDRIENYLHAEFGNPCEFGSMSCESIAQSILEYFRFMSYCEVLEDNYGGAALTR